MKKLPEIVTYKKCKNWYINLLLTRKHLFSPLSRHVPGYLKKALPPIKLNNNTSDQNSRVGISIENNNRIYNRAELMTIIIT